MFNWQLIVVALIVAAAAVYVLRVTWRSLIAKSGGSCGSCNSCNDAQTNVKTRTLVTLDEDEKGTGAYAARLPLVREP